MRREPNKASKDSTNGTNSRLITNRRRSISCSRLKPTPEMDINEMRKLFTTKTDVVTPSSRNRVDSPELGSSMNVLGMQKTQRSLLSRTSAYPGIDRGVEVEKSSSQQKQSSWFHPMKWLKKIRGEQPTTGPFGSMKNTGSNTV